MGPVRVDSPRYDVSFVCGSVKFCVEFMLKCYFFDVLSRVRMHVYRQKFR